MSEGRRTQSPEHTAENSCRTPRDRHPGGPGVWRSKRQNLGGATGYAGNPPPLRPEELPPRETRDVSCNHSGNLRRSPSTSHDAVQFAPPRAATSRVHSLAVGGSAVTSPTARAHCAGPVEQRFLSASPPGYQQPRRPRYPIGLIKRPVGNPAAGPASTLSRLINHLSSATKK